MTRTSLILAAALALSFRIAAADPVSYQHIIDTGQPAAVNYTAALEWISTTYSSGETVVDHANQATGTIIGNGISHYELMWVKSPLAYQIRVDTRDTRIRVTFHKWQLPDAGNKPIEDANRDLLEPKAAAIAQRLADDLASYARNFKSTQNW